MPRASAKLQVVAGSNATISSVGFFDGRRQIARTRRNVAGIYEIVADDRQEAESTR